MKQLFLVSFLLACSAGSAQNLVPNGDFEQHTGCPSWADQLDSAMYWMNTSPDVPNSGSPDYFNGCDTSYCDVPDNIYYGHQYAHSGVGMAGIILYTPLFGGNVREYLEVPLTQTLTVGWHYHFEMYMNVPNDFMWASDDIGVYFSDTAITNVTNWAPLSQFAPDISNPQGNLPDTTNWTLFSGDYWSTSGTEAYMIIGNFRNDFQTSANTVNTLGHQYAYVYIDDVSLIHGFAGVEEENENSVVNAGPNPVQDQFHVSVATPEPSTLIVYDVTGKALKEITFSHNVSIDLSDLASGIYCYSVTDKKGLLKNGKLVKE